MKRPPYGQIEPSPALRSAYLGLLAEASSYGEVRAGRIDPDLTDIRNMVAAYWTNMNPLLDLEDWILVVRPEVEIAPLIDIPRSRSNALRELALLAHEIGHAKNRHEQPDRWNRYYVALQTWAIYRKADAVDLLDETLRLRVLREEWLAEEKGRAIIERVHPAGLPEFDRRADLNIASYRKLLNL